MQSHAIKICCNCLVVASTANVLNLIGSPFLKPFRVTELLLAFCLHATHNAVTTVAFSGGQYLAGGEL